MKRLPALFVAFAVALSLGIALDKVDAQSTTQFPTSPWVAFAPAEVQCGWVYAANLGSTADIPISIGIPSNNYVVDEIVASNANVSLTSASGGVYTGASKTGTTLASNQALSTLTAAAVNSAGSAYALTLAAGATTSLLNVKTVYLAMTTSQTGATADFRIFCKPQY